MDIRPPQEVFIQGMKIGVAIGVFLGIGIGIIVANAIFLLARH